MTTAILSFFGIIIGASLQYIFTTHIETRRHHRDLRSTAYMDYLRCVSEQAQSRLTENTREMQGLFARTGDAKARICLYGSKEAIEAFSKFEELGPSMNTAEQRSSFTDMVSIMRIDSGSELGVKSKDMQNILLGCEKQTRNA